VPIAIGQKLESDFRNPLGLLSDCHRRIERFLDGLIAISEEAQGNKLVSREVLRKNTGTVTVFAFDEGQGLSEHTAPFDALAQTIPAA
jgi:hypothetical protein